MPKAPALPALRSENPAGQLLRRWRAFRRVSQFELSFNAGMSQRHLSFIESGRSRPSRDALIRLADALSIPLRDRNALLTAGRFAAEFRETGLTEPELSRARRA